MTISILLNKIDNNNKFHRYEVVENPVITNPQLVEWALLLSKLYDKNELFKNNYSKILTLLHPFEFIKSVVDCRNLNIGNVTITNAFMKLYEILLEYSDEMKFSDKTVINMYDIASSPGMFVIAARTFFKNNEFKWNSCSKFTTGMGDEYSLYKNNSSNFEELDLMNDDDVDKLINKYNKKKYNLVTGDVGMQHSDWYKLQEIDHLHIQFNQAKLATFLNEVGGSSILKMYTVLTHTSIYLLNTLTMLYEKVYLVKPHTSRIHNLELYIVCINRNNIVSKLSKFKNIKYLNLIPNYRLIYTFENMCLVRRDNYISFILNVISKYSIKNVKELLKNTKYRIYYKQFENLLNIFSGKSSLNIVESPS